MSSPRKRGPITAASGIWVPACAGTTAGGTPSQSAGSGQVAAARKREPRYRRRTRSAGPGEGDFVEGAGAEAFGGTSHRLATERPVEADRRLVVRERPNHQALQSALHQVAPRRGEQLAAEAEALEFRPQVKLVDLAVVIQAAGAIAAVIGVTGHAFAECQHHDPAAFANRAVPPCRAAPVDELVELRPRNDALISAPPGFVVRRGDGRSIGRLGAADFDQGRVHDVIQASTSPRFKSYV